MWRHEILVGQRWFKKKLSLWQDAKLSLNDGDKYKYSNNLHVIQTATMCVCVCVCEREREIDLEKEREEVWLIQRSEIMTNFVSNYVYVCSWMCERRKKINVNFVSIYAE